MSRYEHIVINWFPGHMAKATREIRDKMAKVNHVIEVRDARIPTSSSNPMLEDMINICKKKHIILLNKRDLAHEATSMAWKKHYDNIFSKEHSTHPNNALTQTVDTLFMSLNAHQDHSGKWGKSQKTQFSDLIKCLQKKKGASSATAINDTQTMDNRPSICMAIGFPNVGKSTLINQLIGRKGASVAPKPSWTRGLQLFRIQPHLGNRRYQSNRVQLTPRTIDLGPERMEPKGNTKGTVNGQICTHELPGVNGSCFESRVTNLWLIDSPGIMIPHRVEAEQGLKLALCGCVAEHTLDQSFVVMGDYLFDMLKNEKFPHAIPKNWYKAMGFKEGYQPPSVYENFLRDVGQQFGRRDELAQAQIFVTQFRTGQLGRFTLDPISTP